MAKIMLIGDSITANMPNNILGSENDEIINNGIENIGIDTYKNYCWPKLDTTDVDICILLIGINNLLRPDCDYDDKTSLKDVVTKLKNFIYEIIKKRTVLMVQGLYPTNRSEINEKIQYVNEKIYEYCYQMDIEYLDFYDLLIDENGLLKENYSHDGIHPNELCYNLLANQINDYIDIYAYKK